MFVKKWYKIINGGLRNKWVRFYSNAEWVRSRIKSIYLDINYLNVQYFTERILSNFTKEVSYSLLLKIKYRDNDGEQYGTLSHQKPFKLTGVNDEESILNLFKDVKELFDIFAERYRVEGVDFIQVLYIVTKEIPKLKLKNIKNLSLNKEFFKIGDTKTKFSSKSLPLTTNSSYYGTVLTLNTAQPFIDVINKNNNDDKFKLLDMKDVLSIHLYKGAYIIVSLKAYDNDIFERRVYSATTGTLYLNALDTVIDDITFSRTISKTKLVIRNNDVVTMFSEKELLPIKPNVVEYKASSNPFIGTIDLETYVDKDGISKVYALGFYTKKEVDKNLKPITYYISPGVSSFELVLQCIDAMLTSKYNGYTFYAHNLGRFDGVFILHILKAANNEKGFEYYTLKPNLKDNKLLKLEISINIPYKNKNIEDIIKISENITIINDNIIKNIESIRNIEGFVKPIESVIKSIDDIIKINKKIIENIKDIIETNKKINYKPGKYKITILDSYKLLSGSLHDLSRAFGLSTVKGYFPHKFVSEDTLYYKGNTPSFEFWQDINKTYHEQLYSKNWDIKGECLKYLNKDLISLYNIMNTFNKYVYKNYGVQMTDCITISRLALNIYFKNYMKNHKIPIISLSMYNDIKKGYFGGLTEVYKPYGKDLYYYDVNSLYPFAALNPMPGLNCIYVENVIPEKYSKELFGFYYCEVETNDDYLGLLPVHSNFELTMPNGKWKGWYFSAELNLAMDNGYKINVVKGYNFNKEESVYKEYVLDLYKTKSESSGSNRAIAKSLLNNLLGRFGINIKKAITEIVDDDKLNFILQTCEYVSINNVTDKDYLVTYYPTISKEICDNNGLDYFKIINTMSNDLEKDKEFKDASVVIAAAINSYARVYMSKVKMDIIKNGGKLYYTDTDSIVTDKPLSNDLIGKDLGQFKLEHRIAEGYFISGKTYCIVVYDGFGEGFVMLSIVIKTKGLNSNSITLDDFKDMYNCINIKGIKQNTITNYGKGSVVIGQKDVILNHNSYKKREKIYKNNRWVDTRPLVYNNTNVSLFNQTGTNRKYGDNATNVHICNCVLSNKSFNESMINNVVNSNIYYKDNIIIKLINIMSIYITKYSKYIFYIGFIMLMYIICLMSSNFIEMGNELFEIYTQEINRVNGERIKFMLENRIKSNNVSLDPYLKYNKISKFIDINDGWIIEPVNVHNKGNVLNNILNNLDLNFKPITSVFNTPLLNTHTSLVEYIFEARPRHPNLDTMNPLGIQGLNHNIDQVINMVDSYMVENRQHTLELLNYQSNILYILVNNLTPTIY